MAHYCEHCKKGYEAPLKLGTRLYCPHCKTYLGTTIKPEKPNLPPTWWRTKTGEPKEFTIPKTDPPKPEDYPDG